MSELKRFQESTPSREWPEHWIKAYQLLKPIEWCWSSCIRSRQNLVIKRRNEVQLILPFTGGKMRALMEQWLEEEEHSGLWD